MAHHNYILKENKKHLTLDELHLNSEARRNINQLLEEFAYVDVLNKYQLPVDNKVLLHGHTGCGKTATANAIGLALNKKVITINLSGFVSSRLGETAKNLSEIFRQAAQEKAILFIDEFDFIGKLRDYDEKDSGEMKRLVNALIQQIDHLSGQTLLICATNHMEIIDTALLRRFQIKLNYELPTQELLNEYYDNLLSTFPKHLTQIQRRYAISYAEAKDLTLQQVKAQAIALEKAKKHLVFIYDRFRVNDVENILKNQPIAEEEALLSNHILPTEEHNKVNSYSDSIITQKFAESLKDATDQIQGIVYELTGAQLIQTDMKSSNYRRVMATTTSGKQVWVYISKN